MLELDTNSHRIEIQSGNTGLNIWNKVKKSKLDRSSPPEVFLEKGVLKSCCNFTREDLSKCVTSTSIKITLLHGCTPVSLLHIFRAYF